MRDLQALQITVGAGLPAMVVNDDAYSLTPSGALRFFASRARSYRFCGCMRDLQALQSTNVGAGLPAMVVNDDACSLTPSGALRLFAGKPAPTGSVGACRICKHRK